MSRSRRLGRLLRRPRPFGLASWVYFRLDLSAESRLHRALFLASPPGLPPALRWPLQLGLWLGWLLFTAWWASGWAVRRFGPTLRAREGIGLGRQLAAVLGLALAHSIPPASYYRLELYRSERRRRLWSYLFAPEGHAYHRQRNGDADAGLLDDKARFAREALDRGLPAVAGGCLLPAGTPLGAALPAQGEALFLKPNRGNAARGAFRLSLGEEGLLLTPILGRELRGGEAEAFAARRLAEEAYLLQPCLGHHPALAPLAGRDETITLRLITARSGDEPRPWFATLEVPLERRGEGGYAQQPVVVESGALGRPLAPWPAPEEGEAEFERLSRHAGECLPHWREAVAAAVGAHGMLPGFHAVAWDLVITPEGARLLEGNSNWGMMIPQRVMGGLLAEGGGLPVPPPSDRGPDDGLPSRSDDRMAKRRGSTAP